MLRQRTILYFLGGAALIAASVVYYLYPAWAFNYPGCWFRARTGLSCPSCGGQRAFSSLLHGDIHAAFRYNALFVAALIAVPCVLVWWKLAKRAPLSPRATICLLIGVLLLMIAFTVVRNL